MVCGAEPGDAWPPFLYVVSNFGQLQGDLTLTYSSAFLTEDEDFLDPLTSALRSLVLDSTHVDFLFS